MSEQRDQAADIEQRYVGEHAENEEMLEGLDPENTDQDAVDQVEGVGDDPSGSVERMAGEES